MPPLPKHLSQLLSTPPFLFCLSQAAIERKERVTTAVCELSLASASFLHGHALDLLALLHAYEQTAAAVVSTAANGTLSAEASHRRHCGTEEVLSDEVDTLASEGVRTPSSPDGQVCIEDEPLPIDDDFLLTSLITWPLVLLLAALSPDIEDMKQLDLALEVLNPFFSVWTLRREYRCILHEKLLQQVCDTIESVLKESRWTCCVKYEFWSTACRAFTINSLAKTRMQITTISLFKAVCHHLPQLTGVKTSGTSADRSLATSHLSFFIDVLQKPVIPNKSLHSLAPNSLYTLISLLQSADVRLGTSFFRQSVKAIECWCLFSLNVKDDHPCYSYYFNSCSRAYVKVLSATSPTEQTSPQSPMEQTSENHYDSVPDRVDQEPSSHCGGDLTDPDKKSFLSKFLQIMVDILDRRKSVFSDEVLEDIALCAVVILSHCGIRFVYPAHTPSSAVEFLQKLAPPLIRSGREYACVDSILWNNEFLAHFLRPFLDDELKIRQNLTSTIFRHLVVAPSEAFVSLRFLTKCLINHSTFSTLADVRTMASGITAWAVACRLIDKYSADWAESANLSYLFNPELFLAANPEKAIRRIRHLVVEVVDLKEAFRQALTSEAVRIEHDTSLALWVDDFIAFWDAWISHLSRRGLDWAWCLSLLGDAGDEDSHISSEAPQDIFDFWIERFTRKVLFCLAVHSILIIRRFSHEEWEFAHQVATSRVDLPIWLLSPDFKLCNGERESLRRACHVAMTCLTALQRSALLHPPEAAAVRNDAILAEHLSETLGLSKTIPNVDEAVLGQSAACAIGRLPFSTAQGRSHALDTIMSLSTQSDPEAAIANLLCLYASAITDSIVGDLVSNSGNSDALSSSICPLVLFVASGSTPPAMTIALTATLVDLYRWEIHCPTQSSIDSLQLIRCFTALTNQMACTIVTRPLTDLHSKVDDDHEKVLHRSCTQLADKVSVRANSIALSSSGHIDIVLWSLACLYNCLTVLSIQPDGLLPRFHQSWIAIKRAFFPPILSPATLELALKLLNDIGIDKIGVFATARILEDVHPILIKVLLKLSLSCIPFTDNCPLHIEDSQFFKVLSSSMIKRTINAILCHLTRMSPYIARSRSLDASSACLLLTQRGPAECRQAALTAFKALVAHDLYVASRLLQVVEALRSLAHLKKPQPDVIDFLTPLLMHDAQHSTEVARALSEFSSASTINDPQVIESLEEVLRDMLLTATEYLLH